MSFESICSKKECSIILPEFTGERVYMREIRKDKKLPPDLSRWQLTVDAMLKDVDSDGPMYLMIDQAAVVAGKTHRRPGVHIDGYWVPSVSAHSTNSHREERKNDVHSPRQGHQGGPVRKDDTHQHHRKHMSGASRWEEATFESKEGLLLLTDVHASNAYVGVYNGHPHEGGDCQHVDIGNLETMPVLPGFVYAGNVTMLHESIPVKYNNNRTLVSINVPDWHPH